MIPIVYVDAPPAAAVVDPYIRRWLPFAPTWCTELRVFYVEQPADDEHDHVLTIRSEYGYRFAKLRVFPYFAKCTERERHECMLHEIVHLFTAPLQIVADHLAGSIVDDAMRSFARAEVEVGLESSVVDLTTLLMSLLYKEPTDICDAPSRSTR